MSSRSAAEPTFDKSDYLKKSEMTNNLFTALSPSRSSRRVRSLSTRPRKRLRLTAPQLKTSASSTTYFEVDGEYWASSQAGSAPTRSEEQWDDYLTWLKQRRTAPHRAHVTSIGTPVLNGRLPLVV